MPRPNNDRITIGLYSLQSGNLDSILGEISNIKLIRNHFRNAASKAEREPPEIIVSLFLVPNWNKGSNFENIDYIIARKR